MNSDLTDLFWNIGLMSVRISPFMKIFSKSVDAVADLTKNGSPLLLVNAFCRKLVIEFLNGAEIGGISGFCFEILLAESSKSVANWSMFSALFSTSEYMPESISIIDSVSSRDSELGTSAPSMLSLTERAGRILSRTVDSNSSSCVESFSNRAKVLWCSFGILRGMRQS